MVEILGQLAELEILGNAVRRPGNGVRLEGAEQQLAGILLEIGAMVGVAQHRKGGGEVGEILGDDVEMLAGLERDVDAAALAERARPHAGGDDDVLGRDLALVGDDAGGAPFGAAYRRDLGVLEDLRAARPRALGESHGGVDRIGLAVLREEDAADHIVDIEQRPMALDLAGADLVDLEAEGLRHRGAAQQLLEALARRRHRDAAALLEAGRLAGLRLERRVEPGGVLREPRHVERRPELPDEARGMPGRAAGQALALQQDDVRPAELGQMIGDRAADGAAADDDDAGVARNSLGHRSRLSSRMTARRFAPPDRLTMEKQRRPTLAHGSLGPSSGLRSELPSRQ